MDNKLERTSKLERYLRSRGTYIPNNIDAYTAPHGDLHIYCPLCDDRHDDIPLKRRHLAHLRNYRIIEGAYTCQVCQNSIDMMDEVIDQRIVNMDVLKKDVKKNARIDKLLHEGKLDQDVFHSLLHLDGRFERDSGFPDDYYNGTHCYFCDTDLKEEDANKSLHVPCGNDIYTVDGGDVAVCNNCYQDFKARLPEGKVEQFYRNEFVECDCPTCTQTYYITKEESHSRAFNNLFDSYQCGSCAYAYLSRNKGGRFLYPKRMHGFLRRFIDDQCDLCEQIVGVDQLHTPNFILTNHVNADGKYVCKDCRAAGVPAIIAIITGKYVINVAPGLRFEGYHIRKRTTNGHTAGVLSIDNTEDFEKIMAAILEKGDDWTPPLNG